jgi:acetolactate synthase-1/2/3 large subunit
VLTTVQAKGTFAGDEFHLGLTGMMASPLAREVAAGADLVVVLGAALDQYNTDVGRFVAAPRIIAVDRRGEDDLDELAGGRILRLRGDAAGVAEELNRRLPVQPMPGWRDAALRQAIAAEADRVRSLAAKRFPDGPNPWAVVAALDGALPGDAHVVVGIGHFWYFVAPYLFSGTARSFQFGCGFASIGQALPIAIGAAAAAPGAHVVCVEGDGSLLMSIQELQSAVRFGLDLTVVVLDNAAYGSEYYKLALAGLDPDDGAFDRPMDLVAVATAMGATARRVTDAESIPTALHELRAVPGVRLLDVAIARSAMSEVYQREHGSPRTVIPPAAPAAQ